jgi:hypothetical protein
VRWDFERDLQGWSAHRGRVEAGHQACVPFNGVFQPFCVDQAQGLFTVPAAGGVRLRYRAHALRKLRLRFMVGGKQVARIDLLLTTAKQWRWLDVPFDAFKPTGAGPGGLQAGTRVQEINFIAKLNREGGFLHFDHIEVYRLPVAGAPSARVLFHADFEDGATERWAGREGYPLAEAYRIVRESEGRVLRVPRVQNSPWHARAAVINFYRRENEVAVRGATRVSLRLRHTGFTNVELMLNLHDGQSSSNYAARIQRPPGRWHTSEFTIGELKPKGPPLDLSRPVLLKSLSVSAGPPDSSAELWIDEVRVYNPPAGNPPAGR